MENEENASYTIFKDANNMSNDVCIKIPFEEYKELLIIKGKYEELKRLGYDRERSTKNVTSSFNQGVYKRPYIYTKFKMGG